MKNSCKILASQKLREDQFAKLEADVRSKIEMGLKDVVYVGAN
jgi:hypothetical protein